jgi:UDP-glucose 4-epimerase
MINDSIWITGAHGFIGKHLARTLASTGHNVSGLGHGIWPEKQAAAWGVTHWINGDIFSGNLQLLQQLAGTPDVVYHLAGGSSVGVAIANPREDFFRTVGTTIELLEWLRLNAPAARLVAVSSAAVYGSGHLRGICEDQVREPFSPYGYHKLIMEQLCQSYSTSYGTRVVVARLFSVYGSFLQKQLLWDLCTKLASGVSTLELGGSGEELRDWTDVRDVARALSLVKELASDYAPIINVGTGRATSVREVASIVIDSWPTVANIMFSGKSRTGDPFSLVADGSRLRALGFEWEVPLETGICDYVAWYLRESGAVP